MPRLRTRATRAFLAAVAAVFAASLLRSAWEPGRIVDAFFAQRVEREAMQAWRRRACDADWARCREQPGLCVDQIVLWPVTHPAPGVSRYGTDGSQPILWRNDEQVPRTTERFPFTAVAMVKRVGPLGIELIFLGTPEAAYGGTTWRKHFGLISDAPGSGPNAPGRPRRIRAAVRP